VKVLEKLKQLKYRAERVKQYVAWISLYMIATLYYDTHTVQWWHYFVPVLIVAIVIIDDRFMIPGEINLVHKKSKVMKKMQFGQYNHHPIFVVSFLCISNDLQTGHLYSFFI